MRPAGPGFLPYSPQGDGIAFDSHLGLPLLKSDLGKDGLRNQHALGIPELANRRFHWLANHSFPQSPYVIGLLMQTALRILVDEAASAIADVLAVTGADPDHSVNESRWIAFGMSNRGRVLAVTHTEEWDTIRIISSRPATRLERKLYEET